MCRVTEPNRWTDVDENFVEDALSSTSPMDAAAWQAEAKATTPLC